jgi:hypothetical protein
LVSSISYESTKPFDKQLDDLSISLNEQSTMRDLLAQVKGTPVRVEVAKNGKKESIEGTIIGKLALSACEQLTRRDCILMHLIDGRIGEENALAPVEARCPIPGPFGEREGHPVLQYDGSEQAHVPQRAHAA